MKKQCARSVLFVLLMILICACGKTEDDKTLNIENEESIKTETVSEEYDNQDEKVSDNSVSTEITLYFSNEDATAFETKTEDIQNISPEHILNIFVSNNILNEDIQILDFKTTKYEEKDAIEIDFNEAFSQYISEMGTTGEYYCLGSLCNTFLDAYDCEWIKITVEEETLVTGHNEYPNYMTMFY